MTHPIGPVDDAILYTVPQVMKLLQLGRRTVEERIRSGELKSYKIGRARRVDREAVEEFLKKCEVGGVERSTTTLEQGRSGRAA